MIPLGHKRADALNTCKLPSSKAWYAIPVRYKAHANNLVQGHILVWFPVVFVVMCRALQDECIAFALGLINDLEANPSCTLIRAFCSYCYWCVSVEMYLAVRLRLLTEPGSKHPIPQKNTNSKTHVRVLVVVFHVVFFEFLEPGRVYIGMVGSVMEFIV